MRISMKNLIPEPQMGRQHLSRNVWTEVERQWFLQIGEVVLCQEIVPLLPGLLGLLQALSPVLQVLLIFYHRHPPTLVLLPSNVF